MLDEAAREAGALHLRQKSELIRPGVQQVLALLAIMRRSARDQRISPMVTDIFF
jgi:hypothetical protein